MGVVTACLVGVGITSIVARPPRSEIMAFGTSLSSNVGRTASPLQLACQRPNADKCLSPFAFAGERRHRGLERNPNT
jgi:hypothetical protein